MGWKTFGALYFFAAVLINTCAAHRTSSPETEASAPLAKLERPSPKPLCTEAVKFFIEDAELLQRKYPLSAAHMRAIIDAVNVTTVPSVRVRVSGLPCASRGCCTQRILVRPQGSDATVLATAIAEYRNFLDKLTPHVQVNSILEGGGNIGIATMIFANLYPRAKIVVLEAERSNCLLLKANTLAYPNVHVHCKGLWNEATSLALKAGGGRKAWGWRIQAASNNTEGAVETTTVDGLLKEHGLDKFDFVKLDIEGAEFKVIGNDTGLGWLDKTQLLAMEIHGWVGSPAPLLARLQKKGFHLTRSGEYSVFSRANMFADFIAVADNCPMSFCSVQINRSGIPLEDMLRQVAAFGVAKTAVPRAFRVATPRSFRLTVYSMKDISPTEAQSAVNDGATYLDVRTVGEFQGKRVSDAINIPFMIPGGAGLVPSDDFVSKVESQIPDKGTKLVVACQLGGRSAKAAAKLAELGYTDVSNMRGGLNAWLAEDLPVEG